MPGMKKIPIALAASIPPMTAVPIIWRATEPAPLAVQSGTQPRINANDVIRIGRSRELDDQDRVLCRQPNQHDQSDLRVDVAFDLHHIGRQKNAEQDAAQPKHRKSSEDRHGRAEQHAEWQRPAFVKSRENQEDEQQRQSKDHRGWHSLARFLLQKRDSGVVESHLARHGLPENLFEGCARLIGAEARRGAAVDLGAAILVKTHREFRAELRFNRGERRERNVLALVVADIESPDVIRAGAIVAFGLDVNLPLTAEAVEVVNEIAAHESLDGAVDIGKIDALFQYFVTIHFNKFLRNAGQKSGAQAGNLGSLSRRFKKRVHIVREKSNAAAGAVFEDECESTGGANTGDRWRRKTESNSCRQFCQLLIQMRLDRLKLFGSGGAFIPRLESDDEESVVAGTNKTEQAETDDAGRVFHPRCVRQNVFDLCRGLRCPLQRSAVGQLQIDIRVALIFIRKEAGRHTTAKETSRRAKSQQQDDHHEGLFEQDTAPTDIAVGGPLKNAVEPIEESPQQSVALFAGTKQQCCQ